MAVVNADMCIIIRRHPNFDQDAAVAALAEIDLHVARFVEQEVRGAAVDLWTLILETDWSAVRDTLVAAALAKGAGDASSAGRRGARAFHRALLKLLGEAPGRVELRDPKREVRIRISAEEAMHEDPWLKLFETGIDDEMMWDADTKQWRRN